MVVFTCQNCGDSLKKAVVEKHYNTKCRFNRPNLTCVDCLKDFFDQEYDAHTECVTEAERYSAKGTVFKEKTGKSKQQKYVNMIQNLLNSKDLSNSQRKLISTLSHYNNVPRKEQKFVNFMKNVNRKADVTDLHSVFKLLENTWAKEVQQTTPTVAAAKGALVSENSGVMESCDKQKNGNNQLEEAEENVTKTNAANTDDSKENVNGMSKKELKKQRKYQKYLAELESAEKSNVNGAESNADCSMEVEETNERDGKSNKKSKKSKTKVKADQMDSLENGVEIEKMDTVEVNLKETNSKKSKKRKLIDPVPEIVEKKNKLDSFEGDEDAPKTFDWAEVIVKVLESRPDNELSLKRLGKKVVGEYQTVKPDHHTYEQLLAKFNKKVNKTSGVRVLKDKAKLVK